MTSRKIKFISKYAAQDINPTENMAIISISEPNEVVYLSDNWNYKLSLCFHDAVKQHSSLEDEHGYLFEKYTLFSEKDAENIINFYESLPDDVDELIVHCHAGVSRSAGVVIALGEIYELQYDKKYLLHNKLVYYTIVDWYNLKYKI